MRQTETLTLSIPGEVAERLDKLAWDTRETRSSLARRLLVEYLQNEQWRLQSIKEGIADLDAGRAVPHEAVDRWLASWGTDQELPARE